MADKIHFQITTADGVVCDAMASYALIPLTDGDVGVLADHAPMIGALNEGVVKYVSEGADHFAAVSGGAFYYFKIMKPKKDAAKGSSNLDDLDFDEDDEDEEELETEQEDEKV